MKTLAILGMALNLPVLGLIYSGRILWSAVLALLAGLGLACSKSDGTPDNAKPSTEADNPPQPIVTCYQTVAPAPVFSEPKWVGVVELENWAYAERAILAVIHDERINFDQLQPLIKQANDAYAGAQSAVGKGLLSTETYQLAGQFFAEWHQTIATTHSEVLCYKSLLVTPMIADVNTQLTQLNDLRRAGKLNKAAVEQAMQAIKQRMGKETSPAVAEELSRLLIQILEF
jgi:hypothetical protein